MMTYILFYLVLYPLSYLPLPILYFKGKLFYFIIAYIVKYRSAVIIQNLQRAFPEKSEEEIKAIQKRYYKHLSELAVEMIKMLSISKKDLMKRYHCSNPQLVDEYYDAEKSVILMSSHYNNWEWMVLSLDNQFKHHGVGIGAPNSNKTFERLINKARTRYGNGVVFANTVRRDIELRENNQIFSSYMMLCDQSPGNPDRSYKTYFFNQPSGVIFGAEHFAKKYDIPVLYYEVIKEKRGHYRIDVQLISDKPSETAHGEITEQYLRLLEKTISVQPEYWLWSHKRWKHRITPEDIEIEKNN